MASTALLEGSSGSHRHGTNRDMGRSQSAVSTHTHTVITHPLGRVCVSVVAASPVVSPAIRVSVLGCSFCVDSGFRVVSVVVSLLWVVVACDGGSAASIVGW